MDIPYPHRQQHWLTDYNYPPDSSARTHHPLSLNISSLSVTSPTNPSPINLSPSSALSPVSTIPPSTPISPSTIPFSHHNHFQFDPAHYDDQFDSRRTPGPSRSSSTSSTSQPPRKRSFTSNPTSVSLNSSLVVEENIYDEARDTIDLPAYDEMDIRYGPNDGSPVDGSGSGSGGEDALGGTGGQIGMSMPVGMAGSMNILGKPMPTNNFVAKLYQYVFSPSSSQFLLSSFLRMISDPKSTHFIAWTELGTSFVVQNVGEFSRSILGSHFKHNNVCTLFLPLLRPRAHLPLKVLKFRAPTQHVRVP